MNHDRLIDIGALVELGSHRLAEIALASADLHPHLRRRLGFACAAQAKMNVAEAAGDWLEELSEQTEFLESAQLAEAAWELDALRLAIVHDVAPVSPVDASRLIWRFFKLAGGVYERTSDEASEISSVFDDACNDLIDVNILANTAPADFAVKIHAAIASNHYGEFRRLHGAIARAEGHAPTYVSELNARVGTL